MHRHSTATLTLIGAAALALCTASHAQAGNTDSANTPTATPIKHLIVIFGENVSFDHYFGTYPKATNPQGEPPFIARRDTPAVNNLASANLLSNNPNDSNPANGSGAANPFRLDRTQAASADQNHSYTPEQQAEDNGAADLFPKYTGRGTAGGVGAFGTNGQVMGYYDGNTVSAMWRYAQHFAMSDNAWTDTFGPSTPGAIEVISGQTNGLQLVKSSKSSYYVPDGQGGFTLINDVDPANDACSSTTDQGLFTGKNIGDLLNAANVSWGGFMGGFALGRANANGSTGCARSTFSSTVNETVADYVPHHAWFQYYASTANPTHAPQASTASIGHTYVPGTSTIDPANHQYDVSALYAALKAHNLPAVSYVKAPAFQDAHAGYSDPLDEQDFLIKAVNVLQNSPEWQDTAVIITYDDSDGWYDHQYQAPMSSSYDPTADQLNGPGVCGAGTPPAGVNGQPVNGRCGPGNRVPFMVLSPYAKPNYVGHSYISQASVVKFIEDNWLNGQRLGGGSFDASTGSIMDMFDFSAAQPKNTALVLDAKQGTPL